LLLWGFSASIAAQDSGFLGDYSTLESKPSTGFTRINIKPGVENDLAKIRKLMIDQHSFVFSPESKYKAIKPSDIVLWPISSDRP